MYVHPTRLKTAVSKYITIQAELIQNIVDQNCTYDAFYLQFYNIHSSYLKKVSYFKKKD